MSVLEALTEMGFDLRHPVTGSVMLECGHLNGKIKHYAFRYRVGDGHVMTRRGRLVSVQKLHTPGLIRPLFVFSVN